MKYGISLFTAILFYSAAIAQPCTQQVFASYSPGTVCATKQLKLFANTITGASYTWTGPAGFFSIAQSPIINTALINMSGNYVVTATAGACVYKDTVTITVNATPAPPTVSPIFPLCKGGILNFNLTQSAGITYRIWAPGNIPVTGPIYNISSANNGIYKAAATYNSTGCTSDTTSTQITVTVVPKPTLFSNAPLCYGDTLILNVNPHTSLLDDYYWDIPTGSFVQAPGPLVIPAAGVTGYYKVANVYNSCYSDRDSVFVFFNPLILPYAHISSHGTIFPGYSIMTFNSTVINGGANPAYQWYRNGNIIEGANADTYIGVIGTDIFHGDQIYVAVQRDSACSGIAKSDTITLNVDLAVNDVANAGGIQLYPNPNNGNFTISGLAHGNMDIEIDNALGQTVYTSTDVMNGKFEKNITLNKQLPDGMYLLKAKTGDKTYNLVFVMH